MYKILFYITWVVLLEKAFAKLYQSYAAIISGTAAEALGVLTGLPTKEIKDIHLLTTKKRNKKAISNDDLFRALSGWHKEGFILCASCGHTNIPESTYDKYGLQYAHAYAILDVKAVGHGPTKQLVKLRNPWGCNEWKGAWSDVRFEYCQLFFFFVVDWNFVPNKVFKKKF